MSSEGTDHRLREDLIRWAEGEFNEMNAVWQEINRRKAEVDMTLHKMDEDIQRLHDRINLTQSLIDFTKENPMKYQTKERLLNGLIILAFLALVAMVGYIALLTAELFWETINA